MLRYVHSCNRLITGMYTPVAFAVMLAAVSFLFTWNRVCLFRSVAVSVRLSLNLGKSQKKLMDVPLRGGI